MKLEITPAELATLHSAVTNYTATLNQCHSRMRPREVEARASLEVALDRASALRDRLTELSYQSNRKVDLLKESTNATP